MEGWCVKRLLACQHLQLSHSVFLFQNNVFGVWILECVMFCHFGGKWDHSRHSQWLHCLGTISLKNVCKSTHRLPLLLHQLLVILGWGSGVLLLSLTGLLLIIIYRNQITIAAGRYRVFPCSFLISSICLPSGMLLHRFRTSLCAWMIYGFVLPLTVIPHNQSVFLFSWTNEKRKMALFPLMQFKFNSSAVVANSLWSLPALPNWLTAWD